MRSFYGKQGGRSVRAAVTLGVLLATLAPGRALAAAGQLDPSFSGDGRQVTSFPGHTYVDRALAVAIQNGRIVIAGYSRQAGGVYKFALARYNTNGSLDPSFSGDGLQLTAFPGGIGADTASGMAIDQNGKIVVVGASKQAGSAYKFAVARYNANGSLDPSFSGDGRQVTAFPGGSGYDVARGVAIQGGKIVVAGISKQGASIRKFAVARYNANGSLDPSFSGDGRQVTAFPGSAGDDEGYGAANQGGKLVAVGFSQQALGLDFALARYNANGTLDSTFSGDGRQVTAFPGGSGDDEAYGVAIQNGKLVVAGKSFQSAAGVEKFAVARYNANGSLDPTFSGDGRQLTAFPGATGYGDAARAVAIQGTKIVLAGRSHAGGGLYRFAVARYNANGSLDSSFSGDGRQLTSFPGVEDSEANGVAIQNGKIVLAGSTGQLGSDNVAVARYLGN